MALDHHKSHLIPDIQFGLDGKLVISNQDGTFPFRGNPSTSSSHRRRISESDFLPLSREISSDQSHTGDETRISESSTEESSVSASTPTHLLPDTVATGSVLKVKLRVPAVGNGAVPSRHSTAQEMPMRSTFSYVNNGYFGEDGGSSITHGSAPSTVHKRYKQRGTLKSVDSGGSGGPGGGTGGTVSIASSSLVRRLRRNKSMAIRDEAREERRYGNSEQKNNSFNIDKHSIHS